MKPEALVRWTAEDAAELYGIHNWGSGYFDISAGGHITVRPRGSQDAVVVDLYDIIRDVRRKQTSLPVLLRFADILSSQVRLLNESFAKAIAEAGYRGAYRGVYPIKVNQKQLVIQDIMDSGREFHHGLEAGSKAELIAAVALMHDREACLICNGYKDEEFVDLALRSLKMGVQTYIVLEMPGELDLVLSRARELNVRPRIGIRAKLASRGGGHWATSGGDRSKFGLDAPQIIDVVDALRAAGMLDCLQMLHYHLGSQIPDIRRLRTALHEGCRVYVGLVKEGAGMGILNIGGGLAVDYDGSSTNFDSSRNYTIAEYAADVVEVIMAAADKARVPHPTIVSESGRATVAHHSVLVFDVLDVRRFEPHALPEKLPDDASELIRNLMEINRSLSPRNVQEAYHDAVYYRDEIRSRFLQGNVSLRDRALAEDIFWFTARKIANLLPEIKYVPDDMEGLEPAIADVYYGNFSLFQSLPDAWAVDQLFPVVPIHRLNEMPTRQAILADISCDSDGQLDRFIDLHDVRRVLPLHEMNHEEYYIGVFLVGAYQETLGDMHNLLGQVNVIHVRTDKDGKVRYARETPGDSVGEVLSYVEYSPSKVLRSIRQTAETAQADGLVTIPERDEIVKVFNAGMKGYTYFER